MYHDLFSFSDGSDDKESACDVGGSASASIPGSGRSPEERKATHSSILAWEIPQKEESDGCSPWVAESLT